MKQRLFEVHLGGRRNRLFASIAAANAFCEQERQRTGHILSIVEVIKIRQRPKPAHTA